MDLNDCEMLKLEVFYYNNCLRKIKDLLAK